MRERAFSLHESILALGLLGTLLILALLLMPSCVVAYRSVQHRAQAESLGQAWLARLRAGPFSDLVAGERELDTTVQGDVEMKVSSRVQDEPGCEPSEARRVKIVVRWTYRHRAQQWEREATVGAPL